MGEDAYSVARRLRRNQTEAEKAFWLLVRNRNFMGLKFRRQYPIHFVHNNRRRFFIADFYCHELRLIVEIDGGIHKFQRNYDSLRTHILEELKYSVVRFSNKIALDSDLVSLLLKEKVEQLSNSMSVVTIK